MGADKRKFRREDRRREPPAPAGKQSQTLERKRMSEGQGMIPADGTCGTIPKRPTAEAGIKGADLFKLFE